MFDAAATARVTTRATQPLAGRRGPPAWVEWLALAVLQLWLASLRFGRAHMPAHDTLQVFHIFQFDYSTLLTEGEFARWLPYVMYGQPMDAWAAFSHSPASYLVMWIGKLCHTDDALWLFKLGLTLEELSFLSVLFALTRALFCTRLASWMVCLAATLTVNAYTQLWWNFRIYTWLPLVFHLLLLWYWRERAWLLWAAGVVAVCSLSGSLPYFAVFYAYLMGAFSIPLVWSKPRLLRGLLSRRRADCLALGAAVIAVAMLARVISTAYGPLTMNSPGRDPETLEVSLVDFLTYGGVPEPSALLLQALRGWPIFASWHSHVDITLYVGLLPWLMLPWLASTQWSAAQKAVAAALMFTAALSLGGVFAFAASWLPGMTLFRHLSLLHPVSLLLLLLLAGFAMDAFIERGYSRHLLWLALGTLLAADVSAEPGLADMLEQRAVGSTLAPAFLRFCGYAGVCGLAFMGMRLGDVRRDLAIRAAPWVPWLLIATLTADLIDYRMRSDAVIDPVPQPLEDSLATTHASHLPYRARRAIEPPDARSQQASELTHFLRTATGTPYSGINQASYLFMQFDPCEVGYFSPWKLQAVADLLARRELTPMHRVVLTGAQYTTNLQGDWAELRPKFERWRSADPAFMRVLGCDAPKLRLVEGHIVSDDPATVSRWLDDTTDLDRVAILSGHPRSPTPPAASPQTSPEPKVTGFTPNRIDIDVDVRGHAPTWLVYADAYHARWRASVDGRPAAIVPAYMAFKAVEVPAGHHRVRFELSGSAFTSLFRVFAWISGWACVSAMAYVLLSLRRTRS